MGTFRLVEEPQQDFKEKVKKDALETIRHPARIGSSISSIVVGLPGDIASLLNKYAAGPIYEKISGEKATPYEQTALGKILPTSEQHKTALQEAAPKLLKPRNKIEAFGDAIIEDATSLFLPGKTKIPFKNAATKALAISTGANLTGETLKDLSGDEKKGAYAKMGTMFLTSLLSGPKAAKVVGDLYNKAEKAIPKGASINVQSEAKKISRLQDKILAGRNYNALDANEKFVVDEAQHVLDSIKQGRISPQAAWAQKRSLNTKLNEHLFKSPDRKAASRAKKLALDINKQLNSILKRYGNKNSQFAKNFQPAERAFETLAKSNSLQNWIKNKL
ncbi:MAG TPA: hypothetical protein VFX43_09435, partial [Chitinophagaceae bacterium]|nr:hypothetical protein [Chitinophagaceae bacterium]